MDGHHDADDAPLFEYLHDAECCHGGMMIKSRQ